MRQRIELAPLLDWKSSSAPPAGLRRGWLDVGVCNATAFLRAAGCTTFSDRVHTGAAALLGGGWGGAARSERGGNSRWTAWGGRGGAHHDIVAAASHRALVVAAHAVGAAYGESFVRRQVADDGTALAEEREPRRPQGKGSLRPHLPIPTHPLVRQDSQVGENEEASR